MRIRYNAATHTGQQRQINQDWYGASDKAHIDEQGQLLIVCDGMGGHAAGEVASRLGVDTILQTFAEHPHHNASQMLQQAFQEANLRIHAQGQGSMGTTGVAALLQHNRLVIANVGDSRAYLIHDGGIRQISHDHSFVQEQVEAGIMTPEQARHSSYRNMITRALGHQPDVRVDIFSEPVQPGDSVLLCSDGLHGLVEDAEMAEMILSMPPEDAVPKLIDKANERGGIDNITAIVARIEEVDEPPPGALQADMPQDEASAITEPLRAQVTARLDRAEDPQPGAQSYTNPPPSQRTTAPAQPQSAQAKASGRGGLVWLLLLVVILGGAGVYGASAAGLLPPIALLSAPTATPTATTTSTPTAQVTATPTPSVTPTLTSSSSVTTTDSLTPTIPIPRPTGTLQSIIEDEE